MEHKRVLLVMSEDMHREFAPLISAVEVNSTGVLTCNEARAELADDPDITAIVCYHSLPDGSWYCLLQELVRKGRDANVLVVVPAGCDTGTIESHGIYGVLKYPPESSAGSAIAQALLLVEEPVSAS